MMRRIENEMLNIENREIIFNVIDHGLSAIGEKPKQALWFYLEKDLNINPKMATENLECFLQIPQKFFGSAYNYLESLFIKYLSEAVAKDFTGQTNFAECVTCLRANSKTKLADDILAREHNPTKPITPE